MREARVRALRRRRFVRASIAWSLAATATIAASPAAASNVFEYPEQGSEALGRGGAWVARASDPIAIARNPAGLAGQPARGSVGYDLALRAMCFTRVKAAGDVTADGTAPGGVYPRVCDSGTPIPIGYVAVAHPITPRLAIGAGVVTPSGVPRTAFPSFASGAASPQRYLLVESTTLMAIPTISAAYEVLRGLRVGASLGWGIAWVSSSAAAPGVIEGAVRPADNDVKVRVSALDLFVPRATLGAHWSASSFVELGASVMWSDAIVARGDAVTEANAFTPRAASGDTSRVVRGDTSRRDCGRPGSAACGDGGNAELTVPLPATATVGVRLRVPRRTASAPRDPIDDERFDLELDVTWSDASSIDRIGLRFPGTLGAGTIPVPGTAGNLPPNADSPRRYRDVVGFRLGGDLVVVPRRLSLRAGAFHESRAAVPGHVGLEALSGRRVGLAIGATARFPVREQGGAIDLSIGYLRMFVADVASESPSASGVPAIAGTAPYRTPWPVGLGRIEGGLDVLHVGAAYRF
ncbi:MAG: outer membrane protein transport protein [Labilithrix sp.]|nr:outer membrane protein transport protein [Labilithrix sp.]